MPPRRGFTLVEVLVALVICAMGVLALAAEIARLTRALGFLRHAIVVSAAATNRLEALRAGACRTRVDGSEAVYVGDREVATLTWTWGPAGDSIYRVRLIAAARLPAATLRAAPDTIATAVLCRP